jgi:hypothetical protein
MDLLEKMATYVRVVAVGSVEAAPHLAGRREPPDHDSRRRATRPATSTHNAQAIGRTAATEGLLSVSAPVTFGLACEVAHLSSFMAAHTGLSQ